jgi:hypothetical protein
MPLRACTRIANPIIDNTIKSGLNAISDLSLNLSFLPACEKSSAVESFIYKILDSIVKHKMSKGKEFHVTCCWPLFLPQKHQKKGSSVACVLHSSSMRRVQRGYITIVNRRQPHRSNSAKYIQNSM